MDEWLAQLAPEQLDLLRAHTDSDDLSDEVVELLMTGPLSPMQESHQGNDLKVHMPLIVATALQDSASSD